MRSVGHPALRLQHRFAKKTGESKPTDGMSRHIQKNTRKQNLLVGGAYGQKTSNVGCMSPVGLLGILEIPTPRATNIKGDVHAKRAVEALTWATH